MNYKAIVVIDDCEHGENPVREVILVPENAAETVLKKLKEYISDNNLDQGPPISLYAIMAPQTIVCKSVKDLENKSGLFQDFSVN